jgi:hypothetical protein
MSRWHLPKDRANGQLYRTLETAKSLPKKACHACHAIFYFLEERFGAPAGISWAEDANGV